MLRAVVLHLVEERACHTIILFAGNGLCNDSALLWCIRTFVNKDNIFAAANGFCNDFAVLCIGTSVGETTSSPPAGSTATSPWCASGLR